MSRNKEVASGIGIGTVVGVALSYAKWHSITWAIFHGCLGWLYVAYYAIEYW